MIVHLQMALNDVNRTTLCRFDSIHAELSRLFILFRRLQRGGNQARELSKETSFGKDRFS
jgi:hypothetical protein